MSVKMMEAMQPPDVSEIQATVARCCANQCARCGIEPDEVVSESWDFIRRGTRLRTSLDEFVVRVLARLRRCQSRREEPVGLLIHGRRPRVLAWALSESA